ncbi:MAG: crotonase/enoyl-CoA hydratase family protein [Syntrophaceae bacterium]|nr:crotonase/enoyl-CoA hydratase family protein [Syntrophaceae bacterium]
MTINIKTEEHIMLIEIDRPQKYNALTREMYTKMARAYYQLDKDDNLWVGVVYANGPHFTSGLELTDWSDAFSKGIGFPLVKEDEIDPFYMMNEKRCRKPLIFAVHGYCFTWGVETMLNADIRVAAADTRFAMLEVRRGFFPCGGATFRLAGDIGWSNAMRFLLTGDQWSAEDAYRMGLIQHVTESGKQLEKAMELARKVASVAPLGVRSILKNARLAEMEGEEAAKKVIYQEVARVMKSEDMKEGLQSFIERRTAVFKGK